MAMSKEIECTLYTLNAFFHSSRPIPCVNEKPCVYTEHPTKLANDDTHYSIVFRLFTYA